MSDDLDELEAALRASGWTAASSNSVLAPEDEAVVAKLFGATNARRMASTQKGRRARLVRTQEVYAVENSQGWIVGAVEGGRRRVLGQGLDKSRRDQALGLARERGLTTNIYDNPVRHREPLAETRGRPLYWWMEENPEPTLPSKPATPSAQVRPSKRLAILDQLKAFKVS
ncbi:MAG: hypothetical protein JWQ89_2271 [Devosia sp.]|uniref:hypothetical protein n=1 Tax=Devosia sp. TaxID=1871048 RepID=UPI0026098EA4|nr:hypothetical protein [Devosia sp.]MDB5540544.1 hypothetical protein [Devosia sp.]